MNTHPIELLPAYVLGVLDEREFRLVEAHIQICPACRTEAEEFRISVGLSAPTALPPPPAQVKHHLMVRIHTSKRHKRAVDQHPNAISLPDVRWSRAFAAAMLVVALLFGGMMVDARQRLDAAENELAQLQTTLARDEALMTSFLSDRATVSQSLDGQGAVAAKMYMQAGHNRTVLLISGLPPPAPGHTYQFWLADQAQQVGAGTFVVDAQGVAHVMFDAPAPVNTYAEAMVTIEPTGGSLLPTGEIVLATKLGSGG